jgi:hypothetical protein
MGRALRPPLVGREPPRSTPGRAPGDERRERGASHGSFRSPTMPASPLGWLTERGGFVSPTGFVFCSRLGRPLLAGPVRNRFKKTSAPPGLRVLRFHPSATAPDRSSRGRQTLDGFRASSDAKSFRRPSDISTRRRDRRTSIARTARLQLPAAAELVSARPRLPTLQTSGESLSLGHRRARGYGPTRGYECSPDDDLAV